MVHRDAYKQPLKTHTYRFVTAPALLCAPAEPQPEDVSSEQLL